MKWLAKMEYRYGRRAPKNLILLVVGGQIAAWLAIMLFYGGLYEKLLLDRAGLMHLELWRLVTFVFCPSLTTNPLLFALEVYFLYWVGSSLERAWGAFTFDAYFLIGVAGAWVACLITGWGSFSSIYYSLFFAFALLFPDAQVLLFFLLPVKVKWLGWVAGAVYVVNLALLLLAFQFSQALSQVVGLAGFLVFFGPDIFRRLKTRADARRRRRQWENQWRGR